MKRLSLLVIGFLLIISLTPQTVPAQASVTIFSDYFDGTNGSLVNASKWHIPTWVSPTDGTFVGRTQFRVTQNSPLPSIVNSNVKITVQSYNPTGFSFYGYDLISNRAFIPENGLNLKVRAKMNSPVSPGVVGGIFKYVTKSGNGTLHDEIDFEILGNKPSGVQTNVYDNELLGSGHPEFHYYESGTIADYHTYEVNWWRDKVTWLVDGKQVREETTCVPAGPMYLHLNMWAPASDWPEAYSDTIQPTRLASENKIYSMSVDSVNIGIEPIFNPVSPALVTYPGKVTLSGKLTKNDGTALASKNVAIQSKGNDGVWRSFVTVSTDTSGAFSYKTSPSRNVYYRAYSAGDAYYNPTVSAASLAKVRPYVGISVKYPNTRAGKSDLMRFSTNPKHASYYISIQKKSGTSWVTFARTKLDSNGYGSYYFRTSRRGTYYVRAVLPKHTQHETGISKIISIKVY